MQHEKIAALDAAAISPAVAPVKVWLRSEGERVRGRTQDARADLLWDHTFARWWSVQAGGRQDFGASTRSVGVR